MDSDFHPVAAVDFFAARFLPVPGSTCPENFCSGCCPIGFGIAPAGFVVAAADFDLCRNCSAIAISAVPGFGRRRLVADFCLSYFVVEAVALVFVWVVVSNDRSSCC